MRSYDREANEERFFRVIEASGVILAIMAMGGIAAVALVF